MKAQEMTKAELFGAAVMVFGGVVVLISMLDSEKGYLDLLVGAGALILGLFIAIGQRFKLLKIGKEGASIELLQPDPSLELRGEIERRELPEQVRETRERFARTKDLPATDAVRYSVVDQPRLSKLLVGPSAHPMTPMYLLDKDYRILEWNEAFSLAFDRTMEGRQGNSILEWTYHLDNYEAVLDHGEQVFGDPGKLPLHDRETIIYTSLRYGLITATKHAYQIVGDSKRCEAWLICLHLDFKDPHERSRYRYELLKLIGLDQLWSEYAISYDRVLSNARVYRDLIDTVLGLDDSPLPPIAANTTVLDLGAGTGNVSLRLMERVSKCLVVALDNNNIMLEFLRDKCRDFLRDDDRGPGVLAIKQDVTSLFGFQDEYFDCVVANNVFYALADTRACLESVYRVLKPGGELRTSEPHRGTDINALFRRIRADLESEGKFDECRRAFEHVEQINKLRLRTMLEQWSLDEFCHLLESEGFVITHRSADAYAGQSLLVTAVKPADDGGDTLGALQVGIGS